MAVVSAPAARTELLEARPRERYFAGFWVDAFFVGGLSIVFFVYVRFGAELFGQSTSRTDATPFGRNVISWAILLAWIINWPHFAATSYRLYRSRETVRQFPVTAFVVPIVLGAATVIALANPDSFAPWFAKVFLVWSPYHFSGQTIGIALLYARRSGFEVTPFMRKALMWFVFATYIELQAASEVVGVVQSFYGITGIPAIGIPTWVGDVAGWVVIGSGVALGVAVVRSHRRDGSFPVIMLVPIVAQLVWFKLAVGTWRTDSFIEFVPLFHSLQYLYIAWFMQMKERQTERGERGSVRSLVFDSLVWGVMIFLVGAWMFEYGPRVVAGVFPVTTAVAIGVMTSAVQIHHFFVDGVIWKLRNPAVRGALSTSLGELTGRR